MIQFTLPSLTKKKKKKTFYFLIFTCFYFFFLNFLSQWLRLKITFCNNQFQPLIRIASGAVL